MLVVDGFLPRGPFFRSARLENFFTNADQGRGLRFVACDACEDRDFGLSFCSPLASTDFSGSLESLRSSFDAIWPIVTPGFRTDLRLSDFSGGGGGRGRSSNDSCAGAAEGRWSLAGARGAGGFETRAVDPLLPRSLSEGGFECRVMDRDTIFVGGSIVFFRRPSFDTCSSTEHC
jgi:hypothetical protein